ncbi:MAG: NADP-dependent malic enzyme [Nanoarchaeota archaeon]
MKDYNKLSLEMHEKLKGKLEIKSKKEIKSKDDLSIAYTPGVAEPCREIYKNPEDVYKYTIKGNTVAVISDGSAVLGLGNIGPEAAIPVMEGKAILFKEFANIDAFPICLKNQNVNQTIETIKNISPIFGGINLEDFKAPECFEIEQALQNLGIPVMHDDQHGTSVVVLAGIINSLKVVKKEIENVKIVVNGSGAAGTAVTKLMLKYGFKNIIVLDTEGIIYKGRKNLNKIKEEIASITNHNLLQGDLTEAMKRTDIFIGLSKPDLLTADMIKSMNDKPIIFALSNPTPEIMPDIAEESGAYIFATGRSDFPNQVNNVLAFPGIFRGALDIKAKRITDEMKLAAAETLASIIKHPTREEILPYSLDKSIVPKIAEAVKMAYREI